MRELFLFFSIANGVIFLKALHECKSKNNPFGLTRWLAPIGAFVWGDAVVFSIFWLLVSLVCWWFNDALLFWLIVSVFWAVRSLGETTYWFNQQFSTIEREPPKSLIGFSIFKNNSIWFVHQIVWQCVAVVAIIASVYFGHAWLNSL